MVTGRNPIDEFPKDDALWFIKWIDEFRLPHGLTRSASVKVILQRLPFSNPREINKVGFNDLEKILGKRKIDDEPVLAVPIPVLAGQLPLLSIGSIYLNQERIGELPSKRLKLEFHDSMQDEDEIPLGQPVDPFPTWKSQKPCLIVNDWEYYGISNVMPKSRCLVVTRRNRKYVIPQTTIFKAFYAFHTETVKAFCHGPWSERLKDVICLSDLESGLKTEVDQETGRWNIVLQTLIGMEHAPIMALLYFDAYARVCAESIYSRSLQDRVGHATAPWYASAQIPFASQKEGFLLDLKGFPLRSWKYKDEDGQDAELSKFLVTEIVGSSWPNYVPEIGWEKFNSGEGSANPTKVEGNAPYRNQKQTPNNGQKIAVISSQDAHVESAVIHMAVSEFGWLNQPRTTKLEKSSSKRYSNQPPKETKDDSDKASTGDHNYAEGSASKGEAENRVRPPDKRFEDLINSLMALIDDKDQIIQDIKVLQPPYAGKIISRNNLPCWSFTSEECRHGLGRDRKGWRYLDYVADDPRKHLYRSALVLIISRNAQTHYWIEIECRPTEAGYCSVLLSNVSSDPYDTILNALEVVVEKKGRNLDHAIAYAFKSEGISAEAYRHGFEGESTKLKLASLKRFFLKV